MLKDIHPTKVSDDYAKFKTENYPGQKGELIEFAGVDGLDVYNTTVPFIHNGRRVIAGRVEARNSEDSTTMFFEEIDGRYVLIPDAKKITCLQDPFITTIDGSLILGGVNAIWRKDGSLITSHTDFYNIDDLSCPVHIIHGPDRMKDIRLVQLTDGRIAIFSRPLGEAVKAHGQLAAVGFDIVPSLKEVTSAIIANAPFIKWLFVEDEWGGVNQAHVLKNGKIGIIGHKSRLDLINGENYLHYYGFATAIDLLNHQIAPTKLICSRECFPDAQCKLDRLKDVCFLSGIERLPDGKAMLYSGLSDSKEGRIIIEDPFIEYEK